MRMDRTRPSTSVRGQVDLSDKDSIEDGKQITIDEASERKSIKDDLDELGSMKDDRDETEPVKPKEDDGTDDDDATDDNDATDDFDDDGASDGEGDDRQWKDMTNGKFMRLCGTINIVTYGQNHSAVSITTIHPGYYKYWPIMQPFLLPLYVLTEMLCELATRLASKFESAEDLKQAIESDSTVQGVLKALEEHKVAFRRNYYLLRTQRSNSLSRNRS